MPNFVFFFFKFWHLFIIFRNFAKTLPFLPNFLKKDKLCKKHQRFHSFDYFIWLSKILNLFEYPREIILINNGTFYKFLSSTNFNLLRFFFVKLNDLRNIKQVVKPINIVPKNSKELTTSCIAIFYDSSKGKSIIIQIIVF